MPKAFKVQIRDMLPGCEVGYRVGVGAYVVLPDGTEKTARTYMNLLEDLEYLQANVFWLNQRTQPGMLTWDKIEEMLDDT